MRRKLVVGMVMAVTALWLMGTSPVAAERSNRMNCTVHDDRPVRLSSGVIAESWRLTCIDAEQADRFFPIVSLTARQPPIDYEEAGLCGSNVVEYRTSELVPLTLPVLQLACWWPDTMTSELMARSDARWFCVGEGRVIGFTNLAAVHCIERAALFR